MRIVSILLLLLGLFSCAEEKKIGITNKTIDRQKKVLEEIYDEDSKGVLTIKGNYIKFEICRKSEEKCKNYEDGEFVIMDSDDERTRYRINDPKYSEGPIDIYVYNLNKEEKTADKVLLDHGKDPVGDYFNLTEVSGEIEVVLD